MKTIKWIVLVLCFLGNKSYANDFATTCQAIEEKIYAQTVSNSDLFSWLNAAKCSFDDFERSVLTRTQASESAREAFFSLCHYYENLSKSYHLHVAEREGHVSWPLTDLYSAYVRAISSLKGFALDEEFEKTGLKVGTLSKSAIKPFLKSLEKAEKIRFASENAFPERYFVPPGYGSGYEGMINQGQTMYKLESKQLDALGPIIKELIPTITACTGSPWRIINVLCWTTDSSAVHWGMNQWHTDGKPKAVRKILIYLSGASAKTGSTEFILPDGTHQIIDGPPGIWAYAKISELTHRGVPPKKGERLVLELRFLPSLDFEFRPFSAGFHSFYPLVPWFDPFK